MIQIKSPVRFEDSLDGLNQVPAFTVDREVRQGLDLGIAAVNPVSKARPNIGKFIRCDRQGSLLHVPAHQSMTLAVDSDETLYFSDQDTSYDFGQVVDRVLVRIKLITVDHMYFYWLSSVGVVLKTFRDRGMLWCEFKGQVFYWKTVAEIGIYGITFFGFTFD